MKIKLPTIVIENIQRGINNDLEFYSLNIKQYSNIFDKCITLYYYIYTKNMELNNYTFYSDISGRDLRRVSKNFKVNNKVYTYKKILTILNNCNVIEIDNSYSYGRDNKFSKSYRIDRRVFKNSFLTEVEVNIEDIFKNYNTKEYWLDKYPTYSKEINDVYSLSINLDEVISYMEDNIDIQLKPKGKKIKLTDKSGNTFTKTIIDNRTLTSDRIMRYTNLSLKLKFQNIWFKVSDQGRIYNSITNYPSIISKFIKHNNRKLYELDIAESQPVLLSTIIDSQEFKNDVSNGNFYKAVSTSLGIKRGEAKILLYSKLLFSNRKLKSGIVYDVLQSLYPGLVEQTNNIKDKYNLAHLLQELEADVMVNIIGKLPISKFTKHDSAYVYEEDVDMMINIINNVYLDKYNMKVIVK